MAQRKYIDAHWDPEAGVWWADSEEIPGFVTEAATYAELVARSREAVDELLTIGGTDTASVELLCRFDQRSTDGKPSGEARPAAHQ